MIRMLLVEDEERLIATLVKGLRTAKVDVTVARTGREGLRLALEGDFEIMVLDIGLPDQEGFTVLRKLRATGSELPVIILTARTSAEDTVRGLERGADDYMAKPFSFDELVARVRLRARPPESVDGPGDHILTVGRCDLDPIERTLTWDGVEIPLSPREFQLAHLLVARDGKVLTRAEALQEVWGSAAQDNVLDVYIRYLRTHLGPGAIETVRGVGYRFVG